MSGKKEKAAMKAPKKAIMKVPIKSHSDFVDFWADYVRTHPRSVWKPQLDSFIDSQIEIANRFWRRLEKEKGREEKDRLLRMAFR